MNVLLGVAHLYVVLVALDIVLVLVVWEFVLLRIQYRNLAPVLHSKHMVILADLTAMIFQTLDANPALRFLFLTVVRDPQDPLVGNAQKLFGMP